ncbi:MAG: transglycosylase domain-containing protein [Saprospiraceae bacterium]
MSRFFDSIFESRIFQAISRWLSAISSPIRNGWNWVTGPVRRLFRPISDPLDAWFEGFRNRNPRAGFVLGWLGTFVKWGFQFLLALVLAVWVGVFGRLPSSEELRNIETAQTTEVYSADSVLIGKFFIENRTTIKLQDISPYVVTALIATEDKRFFEHSGIDFMSWLRVVKGLATQQDGLGGGSTLSQQLAKNLYPRRDYKIPGISLLINKIRENFISIKLESIYDEKGTQGKAELLNLYLNTVPFGGDRFGIKVASKYFFDKEPKLLDAGEAATLVGMLKASTYYDPIRNPNNATERRNIVLRQMVKNSGSYDTWSDATLREMAKKAVLTQADYEAIAAKKVKTKKGKREDNNTGQATYFREYLRTEALPDILKTLKKEDGSEYNLYRDGLKVYTTVHSKMQQYAEEAVQKHMATLQRQFTDQFKHNKKEKPWGDDKWIDEQVRKSERWATLKDAGMAEADILKTFEQPVKMTVFSWKGGGTETDTTMTPLDSVRYFFTMLNCGFMAMDHRNGYVRAWVGGINFKYFKYDHVRSTRQVGSTFKPIVYGAALQDSVKPCDYYRNEIKKIEDWEPHNADERYGGWYSVNGALKNSVNVVAAQLIEKVGIQKTIDLARKMGVTSKLPREFGISLGAADISLYEMMQVYGTIANRGVRPAPIVVTRIAGRDGKIIYDQAEQTSAAPVQRDSALTDWQSAVLRRMMQSVLDSGGTGARFRYGYGIQGDFAGKTGTTQNQSDGWFIVFNPQLVTGAWVGGATPAVRFRSMYLGQGSASARPIWGWFWHKMANDRKFGKLLQERFTDPKNQNIASYFGCASRIWVHPDSLWLLEADSVMMDSLHPGLFQKMKQGFGKLFGKNKTADEGENSESGLPPAAGTKPEDEPQKGEGKEKKKVFDKLFNRKDKDKPGGGN